ncbi:hypothetical protein KAR91_13860 [Candidatus Pacearchaeota archaeon]|nr:hypothetical protein [Candidatus Pacearchaeota archaeon]
MTNKNYVSGAYYERKTVNLLRREGYHAQRTAGSHGLFDVVAVGHGQVRLINIKKGYWPSPKEREAFYALGVSPIGYTFYEAVTLEIWRWNKGAKEPQIRYENDWRTKC